MACPTLKLSGTSANTIRRFKTSTALSLVCKLSFRLCLNNTGQNVSCTVCLGLPCCWRGYSMLLAEADKLCLCTHFFVARACYPLHPCRTLSPVPMQERHAIHNTDITHSIDDRSATGRRLGAGGQGA